MRSQHQAGTTYAPKGKTPVLQRSGKRFSLNLISAISNQGKMVFMIVEGSFKAAVFIRFLQKLLRSVAAKVFLIADRHPVHLDKRVTEWLRAHKKRIELIFLPTFSPELNPDEYFNQDLKTNGIGKPRPRNNQELEALAAAFANRKKRNPQKVKAYFRHKSVAYAQ